ncbi:hypothetical protein NDU88_005706 [Pleurodeles waltl]|uniref:Uncharacterized protein n=1 Tax=Pleurodeles waltl TaxID=8319 RepID=A0AAV7L1L4_PLEWA|nr:hypothetical protein NDU88_005706 [Pleurodeles waltl]
MNPASQRALVPRGGAAHPGLEVPRPLEGTRPRVQTPPGPRSVSRPAVTTAVPLGTPWSPVCPDVALFTQNTLKRYWGAALTPKEFVKTLWIGSSKQCSVR